MIHRQPRFLVIICLVLTALLAVGCSESPQEKYNDAMSKVSDAKKDRKQAQQKVDEARKKVQKDQKKLHDAQDKLHKTQQKVADAKHAVDKVVNDDVLFRTLQKKLLDDDQFSDAAISVGVHHRTVTLTGTVPDQDTHKKAVKIAHGQAGVAQVKDQLQVADKDNGDKPNKHDKSDSKQDQNSTQSKDSDDGDKT